jgi:branched-chain amino acid transport system ATP-binding protein
LAERRGQRASSLSGGQQQMLAIGRALMSAPRLLMVDEASLGLAPTTTELMFEALARLGADGLSILLVEQNARASLEIAARAYVLERGSLRLSGTASELLHDERVTSTYLGGHLDGAPVAAGLATER